VEACVAGAWSNVLVNLISLPQDDPRKVTLKTQAAHEMKTAANKCAEVLAIIQQRMESIS
jgi:hypothetical protein